VRVPAEVLENVCGAAERRLDVDHPAPPLGEAVEKALARLGGRNPRFGEGEVASDPTLEKPFAYEADEGALDLVDGEQVPALVDPVVVAQVEPTCGDDAVDMWVVVQRPRPRMQDRGDAEARMPAGTSEVGEDGRHRLKEQAVHDAWMATGQATKLRGKREDDVVVPRGEQPLLALANPAGLVESLAGRAVAVATRVVVRHPVLAPVAGVDVPSQGRRTADLDRAKKPTLIPRQRLAAHKRRGMRAKEFEQARRLRAHGTAGGWGRRTEGHVEAPSAVRDLPRQQVQGIGERSDQVGAHLGVPACRLHMAVTKERLKHANINAGFEHVRREAVP